MSWSEETKTGVVLHLVSAVAVAGRLGMTAIGTSPADADRRFGEAEAVMGDLVAEEASTDLLNTYVRLGPSPRTGRNTALTIGQPRRNRWSATMPPSEPTM